MIAPASIELDRFLTTWFGPPGEAKPLPEQCDWLPQALLEWNVLVSRWNVGLNFVTSMVPPEEIKVANSKAVFMLDCGADWYWSFDPAIPGSVFDAQYHEPWERSPESMSEFLVQRTVMEVLLGAESIMRASSVPGERMGQLLGSAKEIAFKGWRWPAPGYRYFMRGDVLTQIIRCYDGSGWDVEVAAPDQGALSGLEDIPDVTWLGY
ncbi:hypothetical protein [Streptomyces sp. NPDC090022]|uniref:hypothetical protein n=1 Tax=Streptomyces sp. NPDC090022 TaxID=3365920 RepID=UPI0037FEE86C